MTQHKRAILLLVVGLISLTGILRADDGAPAVAAGAGSAGAASSSSSTDQAASAAQPAAQPAVAAKPAPAKADNPVKAAMKAAGDLAAAGKTDEAVAAYEKIGVLKSKKAEGWRLNNEGLAYLEATDPKADKAVPVLEKAVAADPGNAVAWNNLGSAYEQTDKLDKAKDAYQKSIDAAKAADGNSDKAQANLDALQAKLDKIAAKKGGNVEASADNAASTDKADSNAAAADASKQ
ncbi:MAG TPA: tetratricopeptide repeat protein [bacterium]|nr:tetratricopeptide repeat protein [bacterium]